MATKKITTGQTIWYYSISTGNVTETIVTNVGNKYFEVKGINFKFVIDTLKQDIKYSIDYKIIIDIDDFNLNKELTRKLRRLIGVQEFCDIPLDKLIKMIEILES